MHPEVVSMYAVQRDNMGIHFVSNIKEDNVWEGGGRGHGGWAYIQKV